jgi:hypothetical protein
MSAMSISLFNTMSQASVQIGANPYRASYNTFEDQWYELEIPLLIYVIIHRILKNYTSREAVKIYHALCMRYV